MKVAVGTVDLGRPWHVHCLEGIGSNEQIAESEEGCSEKRGPSPP